jgi:DUF2075 family protein
MLIYTGTKKQFSNDVMSNMIADKIEKSFFDHNFSHNNQAEYRSWENSLRCMQLVLNDEDIDDNCKVAIEYQIPMTAKRVDFLISGKDSIDNDQVVIIELKQWEKAERTSREDIVTTYVGGSNRAVTHPSYQAYSYAKTIENFNESVEQSNIKLNPCAFLHNYKEEYRHELDNNLYENAIQLAPLFLKHDFMKLREFIKRFVKKADDGEILYKIENGRIRPSKVLQDSLSSMIQGNREFVMIDEQKVAFSTVKKLVEKAVLENQKYTVIIEGGPGTGKSVIAINLLAELRHLTVNYVTKNAAPRNVYFAQLRKDKFKLNYIKNLFKGSGAYLDCQPNTFDCLIVDEAHRLNAKSGMFQNLGENQIKEIITASRVSVFFIDEDQIVTTKDIGSIKQIEYWARECGSMLYFNEDLKLVSQFRCNGSDGYISFLDNMLGIKKTANYDGFDLDYDIKIYDDINQMKADLEKKNNINNKARMVAGYCYEWKSKNMPHGEIYDIQLGGEFKAKWNFGNTITWAIDKDSFDQVGCIHTSQGLEFDYIGVIIGKDLSFKNNEIVTDYTKRAKSDQSLRGFKEKGGLPLADRIIKNTYKTLMTRGQKGCYIYCEDIKLAEYFKTKLKFQK